MLILGEFLELLGSTVTHDIQYCDRLLYCDA